jgi:hypothetical protein
MLVEESRQSPAEAEPIEADASPEIALGSLARLTGRFEIRKGRLLAKAGVFMGALALVGGAESGNQPDAGVPSVPMRTINSASKNLAPPKWTGALEDAAKQPSELAAGQKMQLLQDLVQAPAGQTSNVYLKESIWASPGQTGPSDEDFANLENSIRAAQSDNFNVCLAVWPYTWGDGKDQRPPPLTPTTQWQYTTLLATIDGRLRRDFNTQPGDQPPVSCWFVGNEPGNPTFWRPQFNPDGTDAAAPAYEHLLARSYDTLKKISPDNIVIGGELASHGNDDPHGTRGSHSPEAFIRDMGQAYRDSRRTKPIMDVFGYHPYGLSSSESPATIHPDSTTIGVADYPRLVADLAKAFDGTAQAGSKLPILYSEYGVESKIPGPQQYRYKHAESTSSGAVDEKTQGEYYSVYVRLAGCQPNVIGAFIFHTLDERSKKGGWQSGPNYADGAPKSSHPAISRGMQQLSDGGTNCN